MTDPCERTCACADKLHLTEDDVRRIVSEALLKTMDEVASRQRYAPAPMGLAFGA